MSILREEWYVLREDVKGGGRQIVQYGSIKPDFSTVVLDAKTYVETEA